MRRLSPLFCLLACCAKGPRPPEGMVFVPGGTFSMGCDPSRDPSCSETERPMHEVTVAAFFLDRTEATVDGGARPATNVTWEEARAFCARAGKRLPTEAEWEYAARGRDGRIFPWGDAKPRCDQAHLHSCGPLPANVGGRDAGASPFGVLDLAGNVDEWVEDRYAPYGEQPRGEQRVARGGAYDAWHSRSTARSALSPDHRDPWLGFRCAKTP